MDDFVMMALAVVCLVIGYLAGKADEREAEQ